VLVQAQGFADSSVFEGSLPAKHCQAERYPTAVGLRRRKNNCGGDEIGQASVSFLKPTGKHKTERSVVTETLLIGLLTDVSALSLDFLVDVRAFH